MRYAPVLLSVILIAGCCNHCKETQTRYHEDGRAKPVVAVPAMIDTTSFDAPWSISEELTTSIVQQVAQGGKIYIKSQNDSAIADNPFGHDLSWMKREFESHEFVVFFELVEHELVPATKTQNLSPQEVSHNLNMGVRVRVIDLRNDEPKIVLQELVRDTYYIPKTLFPTDYTMAYWGTEEYQKSPMGIAHAQLTKQVAGRVGDYILLAKSR